MYDTPDQTIDQTTDQTINQTTRLVEEQAKSQITLTLDSSQVGGIETHILTLAIDLLAKGYSLEILFIKQYPGNPLYQALTDNHIRFRFAGSVKAYWHQLKALSQQPDHNVIHTHGYKAGIFGRIFARLLGLPVISTYHSGDMGSGKLKLYSYIDLLTAPLGKGIAVSDLIKVRLPKSSLMIPNFVQLPEYDPTRSTQKAASGKPCQVAFVGRLSSEKGPDHFCQLAGLWHDDKSTVNKAVEFVMYGDGPEREQLQDEYSFRVQFKGHVDMKEHWSDVDVLCISSRYEGLPYVALEAMSRGIPVVTFDVGGMGDLISEPSLGWLIETGDVAGLKNAINSWYELAADDKQQLAENVRDKIQHGYSTAALVPRIEALYQNA